MNEAHQQRTQSVHTVQTYTVNNFLSRHPGTFGSQQWILGHHPFDPKNLEIPGGKSNGTEIFTKKVSKIEVFLFFRKFWYDRN